MSGGVHPTGAPWRLDRGYLWACAVSTHRQESNLRRTVWESQFISVRGLAPDLQKRSRGPHELSSLVHDRSTSASISGRSTGPRPTIVGCAQRYLTVDEHREGHLVATTDFQVGMALSADVPLGVLQQESSDQVRGVQHWTVVNETKTETTV